jgi:Dockerin type I domain
LSVVFDGDRGGGQLSLSLLEGDFFAPLRDALDEWSMRLANLIVWRLCAALVVFAALAAPAGAVVISSANDAVNLLRPDSNPGWDNVGRVGNASGVYLGNRWVITANHVSGGSLRLSDGRTLAGSVGSSFQIQAAGGILNPDLRMFRLAEDPGLPSLSIASEAPTTGQEVMMIGAGLDREAQLHGWQPTSPQWSEVLLRNANVFGFSLSDTSHMRWGMNYVVSDSSFGSSDLTFSFGTRFDQTGIPFEAQAVLGDSGGGVFHRNEGTWELAGLMLSVQLAGNQPSGTAVFGDLTFIGDLAKYRDQIMEAINRADPLWQNQVNHFDVSRNGRVGPQDFLLIANELQRVGAHSLTGAPGSSDLFYDVNGDNEITTLDALQIANALLGGSANPAAQGSGANLVSEPSTAALLVVGLALAAVAHGLARRRKSRGAHGPA